MADTQSKPDEAAKASEPQSQAVRPEGRPQAVSRDVGAPTGVSLDRKAEVPPWERDDAPAGATAESLLTTDLDGKTRVSGPTHYAHTVDGRIVGSYGIGTHHTDADVNGGEPVPVVAHY